MEIHMKGYRQIVVGIAALTLLIVIGVLYSLVSEDGEDATQLTEDEGSTNGQRHRHSYQSGLEEGSVWSLPKMAVSQATGSGRGESGASKPTISAHEIMARIREMVSEDETFSPLHADEVNELIRQMMALGEDALPVVREYLASGEDIRFRFPQRGKKYDYPTMRMAMLETLIKVGGGEALEIAAENLPRTRSAQELVLLTFGLEQMAPGQYRAEALEMARASLERLSGSRKRWSSATPLFEMLQTFGDASVVPQLEQAVGQWKYYATVALAGLPGGVGVPALIELSKNPEVTAMGDGDYALRPLAEVAMQYPEARSALLDQASAGKIPNSAWPSVAAALSGAYIRYANPTFDHSYRDRPWTQAEIAQGLGLIDQLSAITQSPEGKQSLQAARATLEARYAYAKP
jgi:hypothetical protein